MVTGWGAGLEGLGGSPRCLEGAGLDVPVAVGLMTAGGSAAPGGRPASAETEGLRGEGAGRKGRASGSALPALSDVGGGVAEMGRGFGERRGDEREETDMPAWRGGVDVWPAWRGGVGARDGVSGVLVTGGDSVDTE